MVRDGRSNGEAPSLDPSGETLLLRTWSDAEAEVVRQLLEGYGIPCRVVSDVPHAVLPLTVDGLGEVRVHVASSRLEESIELLAEHRRQGLEIAPDAEPPAPTEDPAA